MKKVLIITYYWPPSGGAGVQRWLKFVKYLPGCGWEPVIYCPENPEYPENDPSLEKDIPPGITMLRQPIWEPYTAYKKLSGRKKEEKINAAFLTEKEKNPLIEKLSVWIRGNLFIPDARKFWIKPSVKFLTSWLAGHHCDVIISTGPPHSMHMIGLALARRTGIPWLADFRDPWTNIDFYKDLRLSRWADRKHHRMELEVLRQANAVTVISNLMASGFRGIHDRNYDVITNGYDHEDTAQVINAEPDSKFSLAHIGTLVSTRNPVILWKALSELNVELKGFSNHLEIKLVGKVDHSVRSSVSAAGLDPYLKKTDYLPHDQVIAEQVRSRVLLLIINNTPNAKMILTGKFFEYLAAHRPILCIGPSGGDAAKILHETGAGCLVEFDDLQGMKNSIRGLYQDYLDGRLNGSGHGIEKYSRKELTGVLAKVLGRISDDPNP